MSDSTHPQSQSTTLAQTAIIAVVYLAGVLVLDIVLAPRLATPGAASWYPSMAVGWALMLVFGLQFAPLVLAGGLASVLLRDGFAAPPIFAMLAMVALYTIAAFALRQKLTIASNEDSLNLQKLPVLVSVLLAAFAVTFASVLVTLFVTGSAGLAGFFNLWVRDVITVLTLTPFLLVAITTIQRWRRGERFQLQTGNIVEWLVQFGLIAVIFWLAADGSLTPTHIFSLSLLPLLWIALRHGINGAVIGILVINGGIVLAISISGDVTSPAADWQLLLLTLSLAGLFLGTVVSERQQAESEREKLLAAEQAQRSWAETLTEVALTLTAQTDPSAVLNEILRQVQRLVNYRTAHIVLLEGDNLRIAYWQGYRQFGSEHLMENLVQPLADFPLDSEVILSGKPLLIADTHQEPRWVVQPESAWVRSHIVLPISQGNRVLGLLRLDGETANGFSEDDMNQLEPLVNAAAIALENARLYEQARQDLAERERAEKALQESLDESEIAYKQATIYAAELSEEMAERKRAEQELLRRNRELALLNRVIAASARGLGVSAILEITCRELSLAFGVPQVFSALLNDGKTEFTVVAESMAETMGSLLQKTVTVGQDSACRYLLNHKTSLVVDDVQQDTRVQPMRQLVAGSGTVSMLVVPLIIGEEVVGCLNLGDTDSRRFSSEEVDLVWRVADQVAGALARARLDKERRQLSAAIEQSAESIIITDDQYNIVYTNLAFERITGYRREDARGKNLMSLFRGAKREETFFERLLDTINAGDVWQGRFENKKRDGSPYTEDIAITPIRNQQGQVVNYVSVQRDVTREIQLEEQYYQSQKMDAIGRLTGGIVHDFNNLLSAINGFVEIMQMQVAADDPMAEILTQVHNISGRATSLINRLMSFSRKGPVNPQMLDLNELVGSVQGMLQPIIGKHIEFQTDPEPSLWAIKADPTQIEQIVVNLSVNARDAMPDGGTLTIKTGNIMLDEDFSDERFEGQAGAYVMLSVSDTGTGMSAETKAHIFEPFFTTKAKGKGSGLGLATVFSIVEQCQGHIDVDSQLAEGTTFHIYFPAEKESAVVQPELPDRKNLPRGTENVLVVEDEQSVRNVTVRLLNRQGYVVHEASDGAEALAWAETFDGKLNLLLTDMIMPEVSGQALAEELSVKYPDLKVILMSGNRRRNIEGQPLPSGGTMYFIQKPFSVGELAQKVRDALDDSD